MLWQGMEITLTQDHRKKKRRISTDILFGVKKSRIEHALPRFKLSMKGNLNLNSRTSATEIQVNDVKTSQFIILLLKQSDSLPIHREKVSMRTI